MDQREGQALPGNWKSVQGWLSPNYGWQRVNPLSPLPPSRICHTVFRLYAFRCFPLLRANTSSVQVPSGLETVILCGTKYSQIDFFLKNIS